jgi:methylated-DNA-[protein]-cysteine S-methyltransferase
MEGTVLYTTFDSPVGELLLSGDGHTLHGLYMQEGRTAIAVQADWQETDEAFADARAQLAQYFDGRRTDFDLPLALEGSPFQRRVWGALQDIPYGETISYGEQARRLGAPATPRNVGATNGRNPISIIVPCHRVVGSDGSLTGYGGGLERKRMLLDLEAGALTLG